MAAALCINLIAFSERGLTTHSNAIGALGELMFETVKPTLEFGYKEWLTI